MAVTHTDKKGNLMERAPVMPGRAPRDIGVPVPEKQEKAQDAARRKRMERAGYVNAVLSGQFRDMVQASLEARYHQETFGELAMGGLFRTHNNVMLDVLDRVATAYPGARYYLQRGGAEVEDEAFKRILSKVDFDSVGAYLDRQQLVHPATVIHPKVVLDAETGRRHLRFLRLTPAEFDLEASPHDRSQVAEFTHYYTDPATGHACKCEWDAHGWEVYHKAGTSPTGEVDWRKVDEGEHPFGCIPIIVQRLHDESLWSDNYGLDLTETTVEVCVAESVLAYLMAGQVKTLVGQAPRFPPGQVARHVGMLEAGDNSAVQLMDWQLDLNTFTENYIKRPRRTAAMRLGLPGDEWDVGVPPSGEALRMRYAERDARARARQKALAENIRKLYWLCVQTVYWELGRPTTMPNGTERVLPIDGFDDGYFAKRRAALRAGEPEPEFIPPAPAAVLPPFDPDVHWTDQETQFGLDIAEPAYPESRAEWEARARARLELGLTNRGELLAEENPDAKDPLATVRKNLALERGFKQTLVTGAPVGAPVKPEGKPEAKPLPGQQSPQPPQPKGAAPAADGKQDPEKPTATGAAPATEDTARKALAVQYLSLALDRLAASGQTAAEKAAAAKILELIKDM